jgi:hypothetical protein
MRRPTQASAESSPVEDVGADVNNRTRAYWAARRGHADADAYAAMDQRRAIKSLLRVSAV